MRIFSKIKKALNLKDQELFRRWPASELEEKKFYIQNKPPEEFTTEDRYLAAEWIFQRYLPEGDEPTPEKWTTTISNIRQKIDNNIHKKSAGELFKTAYAPATPYTLSKEDFLREIVPAFSKFNLLPDPYLKDGQDREIWESLFEFTQPHSNRHVEAKDTLMHFCDPYLAAKLVQDLARTHTALRKAQIDGSKNVELVCTGKQCKACLAMNGKKFDVEELLNSFRGGNPLFPHQLVLDEEASWCTAPYFSPEIVLGADDNSDFHAWLIKHFETKNK
ncbi:MAG TPA: hypothetical protein PKE57_03040 [Cellvibrionaceae bacterium]|nr:hypothetical protein [Cellvibrionaceae bacterium]HMW46875.1 hypothetical protein [Cellvibrionaceae bacterium]HMW71839.1 hypothetical protein [Cellvibrionaceae bacterium]HMY38548.1 hypothetical protein [Marinagarivorans sp.]HNG58472.1 hypothetical protein [Cellvibrionaceae bacterium]